MRLARQIGWGGGGTFTPLSLFSNGENGVWYDPSDLTTGNMYQDSAKTTPVTAVEQPVGWIQDKSGNGNHASQSTIGNRPVLSARYNLLTDTEDFSAASWMKTATTPSTSVSTNATTDPLGGSTADKITQSTAINIYQQFAANYLYPHTFSCYLKQSGAATTCQLYIYQNGSFLAQTTFDLSNGTKTDVVGSGSTINSVGSGWYRCAVTATPNTGASYQFSMGLYNTTEVYAWGADLRYAVDNGFGYQSVTTSTNYTTTGFPYFLQFNNRAGTSPAWMTTSALTVNQDTMALCVGTTKFYDTNNTCPVEYSAAWDLNPGSFQLSTYPAGGHYWTWAARGSTAGTYIQTANTYASPITDVVTGQCSISGNSMVLRVNGSQVATSSVSQGTGNFGNYVLNIGSRNNGSGIDYYGRINGLIVRFASTSAAQITAMETWMNTKTKAY